MIKKIFRYGISFLLYYTGILALIRFLQKKERRLKVLVYHRVNDVLDSSSPVLPMDRFRKHLEYLSRYYKVVNISEAVTYFKINRNFSAEAVAITFDDGHKDVIDNVLPIIKEFNLPISVFLTSSCMEEGRLIWTDALFYYFEQSGNLNEFYSLRDKLKNMNSIDRSNVLNSYQLNTKDDFMLNWSDVEKIYASGLVEISAHTRNHPILTKMDKEDAWLEISGSKMDIEKKIGKSIAGFSYPTGKFNNEVQLLVKKAGFSYACAVDGRFNDENMDLFAISRINIDNCPVFVFAAELCGILNWLRGIFNKKGS